MTADDIGLAAGVLIALGLWMRCHTCECCLRLARYEVGGDPLCEKHFQALMDDCDRLRRGDA